jgi:hypothetical protein
LIARYAPANIFHHNAIVSWAVSREGSVTHVYV